jgi:hypothetical protein
MIILLQNVSPKFAIHITAHKIKDKDRDKRFLNPMPEIEYNDLKYADLTVASFLITVQTRKKS